MKGERTEFADSIKKCKQYDNMRNKIHFQECIFYLQFEV